MQSSLGCAIAADTALSYDKYHEWIKRLGEETGFVQVFTTYCLRRATGNAINDDPNSNEAVRNLVMDHTNSAIFQRNYLSLDELKPTAGPKTPENASTSDTT